MGVVSGFWLAVPRSTLAAEVVAHMAKEPNAWNTHGAISGPVTVMVLEHERVPKTKDFDEHGYRGTIVPIPQHGSLAVLMRTPDATPATIDAITTQVRSAIVWGPPAEIAGDANRSRYQHAVKAI